MEDDGAIQYQDYPFDPSPAEAVRIPNISAYDRAYMHSAGMRLVSQAKSVVTVVETYRG